jgi:hypothetical protein
MVVLEAGAGVTGDEVDGDGVIGEADVGGPLTGVGCNRIRFMC